MGYPHRKKMWMEKAHPSLIRNEIGVMNGYKGGRYLLRLPALLA